MLQLNYVIYEEASFQYLFYVIFRLILITKFVIFNLLILCFNKASYINTIFYKGGGGTFLEFAGYI